MYVLGVRVHMSAGAEGGQKSVSDPLGLELQVNCPTEVLGYYTWRSLQNSVYS